MQHAETMTANWTKEASAAKIRTLTAMSLNNFIEIGHEFCEAKARLAHGEFGEWVRTTGHSRSTANNMMRLYQEYGADQWSLFGDDVANVQAFGHLGYSKALALLALPAGEREQFVEENPVEDMSARQLKEAIRERDEARRNEEAAKKTIAEIRRLADQDREEARQALEAAEQKASHAEAEADAARAGMREANAKAEFDRKVSDALKAKIKELESRPVDVAVEVDEESVKKAAEDAKKAAEEAWSARVKEMEDKLAKAAVSGDADLAAFKLLFEQAQADVNKLHGLLLKVKGREDQALAGKLTKALLALADAVRGCAA